ncbi:MAG: S49 family peptidase, partial [Xanthomonadales bacterium]|nr:S49 family peptidase [Xanthomonadales bacterium]
TEEVNEVAQGRVWSGEDAFRLGLVDALGDLEDAIAAAAELAELGEDYTVRYVEKELDFTQRLLSDMTAGVLQHAGIQASEATPLRAMLRDLEAQADELARFNDPNHIYAWSTLSND